MTVANVYMDFLKKAELEIVKEAENEGPLLPHA